jgi:hypothetical protein
MYASALDSVRKGICNAVPPRVGSNQYEREDYLESSASTERALLSKSTVFHSYST